MRPVLVAAALAILAGCSTTPTLAPFSTDGCSLFPDHAPIGKADWCACCLAHDLAYWRGGTEDERLEADRALEACVTAATGSRALAQTMYAGVRTGGVPYFLTSYRWGYGWPYGRMYRSLSTEEAEQADALRARYVAANPSLVCTAGTTPSSSPP